MGFRNKEIFHNLKGDDIHFRKLDLNDLNDIHEYVSDPDVSKYIGWPLTRSIEETREYLEKLIKRDEDGTHLYGSIVDNESGWHIGAVMVFNFDPEPNHAEIGYVIHKDYWRRGLGTQAVKMMIDYGFNSQDLNKIHGWVVDSNLGSATVLSRNGFKLEGQLSDFYSIDGILHDCRIYGLTKASYISPSSRKLK